MNDRTKRDPSIPTTKRPKCPSTCGVRRPIARATIGKDVGHAVMPGCRLWDLTPSPPRAVARIEPRRPPKADRSDSAVLTGKSCRGTYSCGVRFRFRSDGYAQKSVDIDARPVADHDAIKNRLLDVRYLAPFKPQ